MQTIRRVLMLGCVVVALAVPLAGQQQRSRLLVRNDTRTVVELSQQVRNRWEFRGRIYAGDSLPVPGVTNGDRFRAEWRGGSAAHTVKLTYDKAYGGYQDVWAVK